MEPDFDDHVQAAMRRWPDVPAVYGWLRLDRRGGWHLVQRDAPGFDEATHGLGSPIRNPQILAFIARNYASDAAGAWFWQNGPQRVYVDLESAPWILRVRSDLPGSCLLTHTGLPVDQVDGAWIGPEGELLVATGLGPGVVHDLDLGGLELDADTVQLNGHTLSLEPCDDPQRTLGFVRRPRSGQPG